jgi:WD40 repeat protein
MGQLTSDFFNQPITSLNILRDGSCALIGLLGSGGDKARVRLVDLSNGIPLGTFEGHVNESYRIRGCLTHDEASVVAGDEEGRIYVWSVTDVRSGSFLISDFVSCFAKFLVGKAHSSAKGPRKVHPLGRDTSFK